MPQTDTQTTLTTMIPFGGFYDSVYDLRLDQELEQWADWEGDPDNEHRTDTERDASDLCDLANRAIDWKSARHHIADQYCNVFSTVFKDITGITLDATFQKLESPRFYNFTNDRIVATIPLETAQAMFAMHQADDLNTIQEVIKERHSSRPGFFSYYPDTLTGEWENPVAEWGEVQLQTLIIATAQMSGGVDDDDIIGEIDFCHAFEQAMDWDKLSASMKGTQS
jgi:hypothetical protein